MGERPNDKYDAINNNTVSIIIPCWNAGLFVGEAIESALAQTYRPVEVIVVDDGSTDNSLEIIKSFADRIIWRTGPNLGVGKARNQGVKISSGEFIKFLDADDFLLPGCIEKQVFAASGLDNNEFPVGRAYRLEESIGLIVPHAQRDAATNRYETLTELLIDVPVVSAPLYRRNALKYIVFFDENMTIREDFDLFVRLLISGANPVLTNESTCVYRNHSSPGRVSRNHNEDKAREQLKMYDKLYLLLSSTSDSDRRRLLSEGLALSIWTTGRNVLRQGFTGLAGSYFSLAKLCFPERHVSGRLAYRGVNRLLGPILTEFLFDKLKVGCFSPQK